MAENKTFNLAAYPLTTGGNSYLEMKKKNNFFYIYEGQIGQNVYFYCKVDLATKAGEMCNTYFEKYEIIDEHRYSLIEDKKELLTFIDDKAVEKLTGLPAYLKYYNECLSIKDKSENNFYIIQHFEALKNWFGLVLDAHNQKHKKHYTNEEIKHAEVKKFTTGILNNVETHLLPAHHQNSPSRANAQELIKFHEWLSEKIALNSNEKVINPLMFIDIDVLPLFEAAEKKATNNSLKFTSEIRCAAFCETLFIKNYFTIKYNRVSGKQNRVIQKKFAFSRYGIDIKTGFNASKKMERDKHVNKKVDGLEPLRNCF